MKAFTLKSIIALVVSISALTLASANSLAEQVEVKIALSVKNLRQSLQALEFDKDEAEFREIYFVDSMNLDLYKQNLLLRIRHGYDDNSDITVKVRPADSKFAWVDYKDQSGFKCEADQSNSKAVTSCSLKKDITSENIEDVLTEKESIKSLFKKSQKQLLEDLEAQISWSKLELLGPIKSTSWDVENADGDEISVEIWKIKGEESFLEISMKGKTSEAAALQKKLQQFVKDRKLSVDSHQRSKTEFALKKFSGKKI